MCVVDVDFLDVGEKLVVQVQLVDDGCFYLCGEFCVYDFVGVLF